jgi:hypothetical protein
VRCQKCGRPSAGELCIFCRIEEKKAKLPEWRTVLQDGEWTVLQNWHLTSWHKVLRNGEIFAEVQVKVDFPDENTMCEELVIDRQNRTNSAAGALILLRQQHSIQQNCLG